VNGDLEDVEGLLEEILAKVRAGRPENAGNVLKEAKKLAQEAQKKYREAVKAQAKKVKQAKQAGRGNSKSNRP
jgi:ATP/maltotriose-dependent transcriptional regulator MalT